jgi:hypothetical protein
MAFAETLPMEQAQNDANLATRVEQSQAEREALDRLSQALDRVSAGQPAADAIQRGDFADARDQLSNLGEEADQLSDAAKQQLARALQQAANTTAPIDRQLADRERQAAQALSRNNYNDQRQALRQLGEQVERSGTRTTPADQLARDVGRLQQQANQGQQTRQGQGTEPGGPPAAGQQASQGAAQQQGPQTGGAIDQGAAGAGTGTAGEAVGNQTSRLDAVGQNVEVPTKLGPGAGVRPLDGTEEDVGNHPAAVPRTVAERAQAQQTGQVAPEQNLVPGDQRPVVRGYFR